MSLLTEEILEEKEEEKAKALTKDRLVGMKVIDSAGYLVGQVKDVAFTVGTVPVSMVMILKTKEDGNKDIPWEEVQAAGDFVILKPKAAEPAASATAAKCPTCGGPLTYVQQYQRWYCTKCQKYT